MEDKIKIIDAMNHPRKKLKRNHITKTSTSIDEVQLMEAFESVNAKSIIFN